MELKEFIKQAITSITEAIVELNGELSETGLIISPTGGVPVSQNGYSGNDLFCSYRGHSYGLIREIRFDLSVAESVTKNAKGGIGISVINAGMGTGTEKESCNRLQFSIPIVLPHGKF